MLKQPEHPPAAYATVRYSCIVDVHISMVSFRSFKLEAIVSENTESRKRIMADLVGRQGPDYFINELESLQYTNSRLVITRKTDGIG